jgi:uncharacterized damage-inducible protein DinB
MDEFRRLFTYNRWATLRFLDAAEALRADEVSRPIASSFPSVLATLTHMLGAEWVWLQRWKGSSPRSFPDAASLDSVAAVRARWEDLWADQRAFLDRLGDEDVDRVLGYANMSGTPDERRLGDLLRHVVNHGTYHRGQVATLLRQLDRTPPSTDYVRYLRELPTQ